MLTLICGVGRTGKSTYSQAFENVIHLDLMGRGLKNRYAACINIAAQTQDNIVIEGIYNTAELRKSLADAYTGEKRCIWLDTPTDIVKDRMLMLNTPMHKHHFDFEPPTTVEGWDEIIIIRNNQPSAKH